MSRPKFVLLLADIFLVFLLVSFSNAGILPVKKLQDFIFFTAIGLIFALYRPGWAFLFFVGTIALENINLAPEILGVSIRPFQFVGGLALLAVVIRMGLKRIDFDLPKLKSIDGAVIIFALSGFVSTLGALDKGASFKQSIIAFTFAALYFLARIFIQNLDDLKRVIPFFLSSGLAVTFYGIWQNVRFSRGLEAFEAMPGRPNATFAEADWLGIYLVLLIAIVYSIIYYFYNIRDNEESLISNDQFPISNQFPISKFPNFKIIFLYIILTTLYILLILTVSRSAWLGAVAVTMAYLLIIFTQLRLSSKNWLWKKTLQIKIGILISLALAVGAVYFFHLTSFQLWNRAGSTASGLQRITVSCEKNIALPEKIASVQELEKYGCRHIDLENIRFEEMAGNFVKEIDRPDPNVDLRARIYRKSWEAIKKNPILGIGWGNSGLILGRDGRGVALNSSNIFLETWLGSGILGLLALVFIFAYAIVKSAINFRSGDDGQKIAGLFILLGATALLIPNFFNAGIFLGFLWVFLGIAISLV